MHKFFQVPELVLELSDEILAGDDERLLLASASNSEDAFEGRGDLARFAQVCRTISAPALDSLWRSVDFSVVLGLLPISDISDSGVLELTRNVGSSEWDRILFYSRRIRFLSHTHLFSRHEGVKAGDELRKALVSHGSGGALFASLRSLRLECRKNWAWAYPVLFCPSLANISLAHHTLQAAEFAKLMGQIFRSCKTVTDITFNSPVISDKTVADAVARYVSRSSSLRSVHCYFHLSPSVLEHLSRLPLLETLAYGGVGKPLPTLGGIQISTSGIPRFPSLRALSMISSSVESVREFIRFLDCPLQSFILTFYREGKDGMLDLMEQVEHKFGNSLRLLRVGMEGKAQGQPGPWGANAVLTSIAGMHCLSSLTLTSSSGISLDDDAFARLAKALPLLQVLRLSSPKTGLDYVPAVTLVGLFELLRSCPALISLRIDLNALGSQSYKSLPSSPLILLELGWSPIDSAFFVAELFSKVFPVACIDCDKRVMSDGLDDGDVENEDDPKFTYGQLWTQVASWLPTLQKIRKSEQSKGRNRVAELESRLQEIQGGRGGKLIDDIDDLVIDVRP